MLLWLELFDARENVLAENLATLVDTYQDCVERLELASKIAGRQLNAET